MEKSRATPFRTVALTDGARDALRAYVVEMTSPAQRRLATSEVVLAVLAVAQRHRDEVLAQLGRSRDGKDGGHGE